MATFFLIGSMWSEEKGKRDRESSLLGPWSYKSKYIDPYTHTIIHVLYTYTLYIVRQKILQRTYYLSLTFYPLFWNKIKLYSSWYMGTWKMFAYSYICSLLLLLGTLSVKQTNRQTPRTYIYVVVLKEFYPQKYLLIKVILLNINQLILKKHHLV